MLISAQRLDNTPVMSLQTGGQLARTKHPIIDPRNLTIVAYELVGPALNPDQNFLRIADVRELSNLGLIVDSSDEFVGIDDVIKLKEVYDFNFKLLDKPVRSEKKHNLGKVNGYSVEPGSYIIKQLSVRRPLFKSLGDTELLIDRTQIVNVSDDEITVKDDEREPTPAKDHPASYTNPFRGSRAPQTESIDRPSN